MDYARRQQLIIAHSEFLIAMQQNLRARAMYIVQHRRNRQARRRYKRKSVWVRSWLTAERRLAFGDWDHLLRELMLEDETSFTNYVRMPPALFYEILARVEPHIRKQVHCFICSCKCGFFYNHIFIHFLYVIIANVNR